MNSFFSIFRKNLPVKSLIGEIIEDQFFIWSKVSRSSTFFKEELIDKTKTPREKVEKILLPSRDVLFRVNIYSSSLWHQEGVLLIEREIKDQLSVLLTDIYFEYDTFERGDSVFVYWFVVKRSLWNSWEALVSPLIQPSFQYYMSPYLLHQFFMSSEVLDSDHSAVFLFIGENESFILLYNEGVLIGIEILRESLCVFQNILVDCLSISLALASQVAQEGCSDKLSHISSYEDRYKESVQQFLDQLLSRLQCLVRTYKTVHTIVIDRLYVGYLPFYCDHFLSYFQDNTDLACYELQKNSQIPSSSFLVHLIDQGREDEHFKLPMQVSTVTSQIQEEERRENRKFVLSIVSFLMLILVLIFVCDWSKYRDKKRLLENRLTDSQTHLLELHEGEKNLKEVLLCLQQDWENCYFFSQLTEGLPSNVVLRHVQASFHGYMDVTGWAENYDAVELLMSFFVVRKSFVSVLRVDKKNKEETGEVYFEFTIRIWD